MADQTRIEIAVKVIGADAAGAGDALLDTGGRIERDQQGRRLVGNHRALLADDHVAGDELEMREIDTFITVHHPVAVRHDEETYADDIVIKIDAEIIRLALRPVFN